MDTLFLLVQATDDMTEHGIATLIQKVFRQDFFSDSNAWYILKQQRYVPSNSDTIRQLIRNRLVHLIRYHQVELETQLLGHKAKRIHDADKCLLQETIAMCQKRIGNLDTLATKLCQTTWIAVRIF